MKRRLKTLIAAFLLLATHSSAQNIQGLIEKTGHSLLAHKEFKSVSIGIYKSRETYTQYFGELPTNEEPNADTRFEIGSVTKVFVGYLVAQAVLEKKVSLEDDIRNYLDGDFPNLSFEGTPITIKDLVTHTAGLPQSFNPEITDAYAKLQPDTPQIVYQLEKEYTKNSFWQALHQLELAEGPGTNYTYSNAGAELMGYILSSVYDKSLSTLIDEFILDQTIMSHTSTLLDEQVAQGYWMNNKEPSELSTSLLWSAGTGLKSTLPDIMNFIAFNLEDNPVVVESHRLLYEKNTRWMGYFWNIWKDKHGTSFNHHGGTTGTQNWLYIFPKYDLGISIFVNHSGPKTPQKLNKAVKRILKELGN